MLRVLIVDDERLSRRRLRRLLSPDPELEIQGECATGQEALEVLRDQPADLLFLDIQMPGMDGFTFLETLGPDQPMFTIFVTAYDQFALKAFEVHAFDYLMKPYEERRLHDTVRHAKAQTRARLVNADSSRTLQNIDPGKRSRDRLAVRVGENLLLLRTDQVDWIEAADNYVYLHCGGETHTLRETMNALERTLDPAKFLRIHRSAIVNLDRVKSLQPWFRGDYRVILSTGAQLTLSRSYRQNLHEHIMNL